jgi:hypothetical protein
MRYSLRTLLLVAAVVPLLLAVGWLIWSSRQPMLAAFAISLLGYVGWLYWRTYTNNRHFRPR